MNSKILFDSSLNVKDSTGAAASSVISKIGSAINIVSKQRSALGAVQNRLEHTIKNLDNIVENTTSAESQIRDTDMAEEMVRYSNNNILAQAGQSMLAQANQTNQGVLSLLQ
jgi:flagellin